ISQSVRALAGRRPVPGRGDSPMLFFGPMAAGTKDSVVVIGSGPAGAAATLRLLHAGMHVTLLETGLRRDAFGLTARLGGLTVARFHRRLARRTDDVINTGDPATLLFEDMSPGGLTNHWSCAVPRFSVDDFRDAREAGEEYSWPITYEDLVPWYEWVEPLL